MAVKRDVHVCSLNARRGKLLPIDWNAHLARELERYRDGESRLPGIADPDTRQRQLTRLGNAAAGAGLALLMQGRREEAAGWLVRAAEHYRESLDGAPPGSWGRPIGAMKARILAGDPGVDEDARLALAMGAAEAESPIGRYAGCLALLVLGQDVEAEPPASSLRGRCDFPPAVAAALWSLARGDAASYSTAAAEVLRSFETRDKYLEDMPVADTVAVLEILADARGIAAGVTSPLLP